MMFELQNTTETSRETTNHLGFRPWARGYKSFFMLNSAETKIYPAHKCLKNANNCWHFNIYKHDKLLVVEY